MRNLVCFLLFIGCSIAVLADPKDFPPIPNPPRLVNDFAGLLNPTEQQTLERVLDTFNDSTSIEIAVVIISNLGDYVIDDYATQLGDYWGIGKKKKDSGVLLLISKEDRKAFIATGYGMEGVLPDSRCKRIIESELIPSFRRTQYFEGIMLSVSAIMKYSHGEYTADPIETSRFNPLFVLLFILFIIFLMGFINRNNKNNGSGGANGRNRGMDGFTMGALLGGLGGRSSGGFGGNSGGGGFGGFGGGGFGGGGAGGDW
ncbi:MAG: TPM domain-containing protein [Cytophagales bacterium]|nr:TPM domain-containing protein [Cytophaga sp.]